MIDRNTLVSVGRYTRAHGVNGEIAAQVDIDAASIGAGTCLLSVIDGLVVPFFVENCRVRSSHAVLLTIDGIDSEAQTTLLAGREILMTRDDYNRLMGGDDDERPLDFFKGYTIVDDEGHTVGQITAVDDSTANVLFVVNGDDGSEHLIPAVPEMIVDLDDEARIITMDLPQGLLEL